MRLDAERFLEDTSGRYAEPYRQALHDLVVAVAMQDKPAASAARANLKAALRETLGLGEVLGASIALRDAAGAMQDMPELVMAMRANLGQLMAFADAPTQQILPRVTFDEAVRDMVERVPVTLRNPAERTAQRISELYSQGNFVAFVRSADDAVTDKVREIIAKAIREGIPEASAGRLIQMGVEKVREVTEPWSRAYANMVFRTNLNTATTAGRFRQVQDPEIRAILPAMTVSPVGDSDTRPNHLAMRGVILRVDNPAWAMYAPPLGWNCRCSPRQISAPELRRMGRIDNGQVIESRIPPQAGPDEGFRPTGRADLFLASQA